MANRHADGFRQAEADLRHARSALAAGDHEWACFAVLTEAEMDELPSSSPSSHRDDMVRAAEPRRSGGWGPWFSYPMPGDSTFLGLESNLELNDQVVLVRGWLEEFRAWLAQAEGGSR